MAKYTLRVADNAHYPEEGRRQGEYDTYQEAVAAAMKIVDDYLESAFREGMTAAELMGSYTMFGEDPYIIPDRGEARFSARDYAEERARKLCG